MRRPTAEDLLPWNDPDDLHQALIDVERDQYAELRAPVLGLVDHHDPAIREWALRKLYVFWGDRESRSPLFASLQSDPEEAVRCVAAYGIASTSAPGTAAADTRTLLSVLLDVAEPDEVRRSAYEALLLLHGGRHFPPTTGEIKIDRDLDWNWVNELRSRFPG